VDDVAREGGDRFRVGHQRDLIHWILERWCAVVVVVVVTRDAWRVTRRGCVRGVRDDAIEDYGIWGL
jgi:hypothetical protein